jgi:uncharacterized membrane protein YphA (DoxX/SURF4 family)
LFGRLQIDPGSHRLQRLFSTFPAGRPGAGLLLLRTAVGVTLFAQGVSSLVRWRDLGLETLGIGLLAVASGVSLLIGYLTPFGGLVAGLVGVSSNVLWFQTPSANLFDTRLATALATCIAGALVCLGPGAFSIDARLFGRREITIPDLSDPET